MSVPVYTITKFPAEILAQPTSAVTDFGKPLERVIKRMVPTMHQADGVGLAGNQVGLALSVAVIEYQPRSKRDRGERVALHTIVNPLILETSKETDDMTEGCLSCPGIEVVVTRPAGIVVAYQDETGVRIQRTVSGFEARIYQHEIDHLNGLTILDRAKTGQSAVVDAYRANPAAFAQRKR